jgi:ABC-type multidrug transport system permease subunit
MRRVRSALVELMVARIKEFIREPEAIFWVFGFPLVMTLALGFAFREKPPDRIPIGVVEGAHAKERMAALAKSPALQPRVYSAQIGAEELRKGKITLLIADGPTYRFDPTRPESRAARLEADNALQAAAGRRDPFAAKDIHVDEQGSRYVDFLVPGLLGMNLMGTGLWGIGFSIVNARLRKLLKRLVATPMRKSQYLLAQIFSRFAFLIIEVAMLVVFAWLVFDVRIRGSVIVFALLCALGGLAFAGIGLLVASRARTLEAVSGLMNIVMMPMWLCSGVFFSYERFPDAAKPFIRALPLTALNDALRAVMNDGATMMSVLPQMANLALWAVAGFVIGLKIFRWQ